jgi:hypothetical protein
MAGAAVWVIVESSRSIAQEMSTTENPSQTIRTDDRSATAAEVEVKAKVVP